MTTIAQDPTVQPLIEKAAAYLPEDRVRVIREAFEFAAESHSGQLRPGSMRSIPSLSRDYGSSPRQQSN